MLMEYQGLVRGNLGGLLVQPGVLADLLADVIRNHFFDEQRRTKAARRRARAFLKSGISDEGNEKATRRQSVAKAHPIRELL